MVDHDQERIETIGRWEIRDKITGELLEQSGGGGANGGEGWNGGVGIRFVALASRTSFHIFADKRCKAWPPKFGGDKLADLKVTRVASSFMVVAAKKDGLSKRGIGGNVNMSFVGENALGMLPVRQAQAESWRNRSIHGL